MSTSVGFDLSQVGQNNGAKGFAQGIGLLFRGSKQEQVPLNQFKGVLRRKLELLSSTAIFVKRSVNISFDVEGSWPLSEQTELMRVCCLKLAQAFFMIVADANLDQIRSFINADLNGAKSVALRHDLVAMGRYFCEYPRKEVKGARSGSFF